MATATPAPFDELMIWARALETKAADLSDAAYAAAQSTQYIGHRRQLERIGRAAAEFANAVNRTTF